MSSHLPPRSFVHPAVMTVLVVLLCSTMFACKPPARLAFAELSYPEPVSSVHTVEVGEVSVAYTDQGPTEGSGEGAGEGAGQAATTLVLIHGLGSYLPAWKNNLDALARRHRVIAIDLPGYGKSSKDDGYAYSMEFFATTVQGVVEVLGVEDPVLVGHSMGGQIALTHALRYPGKARALVLTSPAGLETFEDGEAQWLADAVTEEFTCKATPEAIYARHTQNFHRMPKDAHFMVDDRVQVIGGPDFPQYCRAVSRSVRAMLDEPVYDRLGEVSVPTLVLFGKYDQLIPNPFLHGGSTERLAKRTVKQLPAAELVLLPRAGHMAQFEQAAAWNEAVLAFLATLPPPPRRAADGEDASPPTEDVATEPEQTETEPDQTEPEQIEPDQTEPDQTEPEQTEPTDANADEAAAPEPVDPDDAATLQGPQP